METFDQSLYYMLVFQGGHLVNTQYQYCKVAKVNTQYQVLGQYLNTNTRYC